ncbi:MAG: chromosomal replication initiator protein DnaA [Muribaculaceae bacterium]|nr:chromosomal replication initiator protein DnaA [Muribaculaceae bacterium]
MNDNHNQLWEECLKIFKDNLSPDQYRAWFEPITCSGCEDGFIKLHVPSPYFIEHLEGNYYQLLGRTLYKVFGPSKTLQWHFNQVKDDPSTSVTMADSNPSPAVMPHPGVASNPFGQPRQVEIDPQLNPRYTFENYCKSNSNQIPRAIGEAIAGEKPIQTYNPLFVFGPPGVGKTHLIQAIGIKIKERRPQTRVRYVTARLFESEFTTALREGKINDFMHLYQSIDVLIVDDIQDLSGKEKTQNIFFHIFNHLILNQKQLIMSSDCAPSHMEGMEARLLSRFKWGATAELFRPDFELRLDVLKQRAAQDGLVIPDDVLTYIAENVTDSVRELEGIVVSLLAHATVLNREIDLDLAKMVMSNAVKINRKQINFEMIAQQVSAFYNITVDQLFTKTRKREVSDARQVVMYLAKKHANMSLVAIGSRLARAHATVLYGCNTIEQRLGMEKKLREDIEKIETAIMA